MRVQFDHEKLEVYQLELAFVSWVAPLLARVKQAGATVRTAEVIDQLDRASLSTLLNTAEGNGRRQAQMRARFFEDARGSATECAACLDARVAKTLCSIEQVNQGKEMLLRIVSMLKKLVARFDQSSSSSSSSPIIWEEADEERMGNEEEDENE